MYRIHLVEDEADLSGLLAAYMEKEGWRVRQFGDGAAALAAIPERPDLWVLDIMLPGGTDGYRLVREIKADRPQMPVIFISARDADIDRIVGLELGSDDYLAKPFLPRELIVRMRKLLERVYGTRTDDEPGLAGRPIKLAVPPYAVDVQARTVTDGDGRPVELTAKEFELLRYLAAHAGQLLSREQVLGAVWGIDYFGSDRVVDDMVRRLRRKMPDMRLETVYGYGYRMVRG
ncbi:response regulator transcription factor [Paenibacillus flagellatus]|uniref:DNA-binding response regulator n=1 Tax=Paenibacillus flagellatus TaxID=2211139 RepID=A0A2V5JZS2_9BACL|nr:response regulator transcription factor [Paenibacillus flagellatus]PYI50733.1 DNA-binding response regulator [Paenibacillus flagellatus]